MYAKRIRIFFAILCICLSCGSFSALASSNNAISETLSDEAETFPDVDRVMREFMETHLAEAEYRLSDSLEVEVTYAQNIGDQTISAVMGELVKDYDFEAKAYLFYESQNDMWHLFVDLYLGQDATVTEKDIILIQSTALRTDLSKSSAVLLTKDLWGNWKQHSEVPIKNAQNTTSSGVDIEPIDYVNHLSTKPCLSGEDLSNNGKDRRILIHETGPSYLTITDAFWSSSSLSSSIMISNTVHLTWRQDLESLNALNDAKTTSLKPILGIMLVILDAAVVVLVVWYIRSSKRKATEEQSSVVSETIEKEATLSEPKPPRAETELTEMLGLKKEDVDYLRSIGYFVPGKKTE